MTDAESTPTGHSPEPSPDKPQKSKQLSTFGTVVFGVYLVALAVILGYVLIVIVKTMDVKHPKEIELILVVITIGAIGSYVHAATSFASYVGNQRLASSWMWWYILRPFIGSALALIFYFIVRAGFLQAGSGPESLSIFGVGALAGLTGMFSKQATDKLRELFDNFFKVADQNGGLKDKLTDDDGASA